MQIKKSCGDDSNYQYYIDYLVETSLECLGPLTYLAGMERADTQQQFRCHSQCDRD